MNDPATRAPSPAECAYVCAANLAFLRTQPPSEWTDMAIRFYESEQAALAAGGAGS